MAQKTRVWWRVAAIAASPLAHTPRWDDAVTAMRGLYKMTRKTGSPRQQSMFICTCCDFTSKKKSSFVLHVKEKHGVELWRKRNSSRFDACADLPYGLVFCTNLTFVGYFTWLHYGFKINNNCRLIQWEKDSGRSWPRHKKDACRLWQAAKECKDKSKAATSVSKAQTRSSEPSKKTSQGRRDDNQEDRNSVRPRRLILKSVFFHYFLTYFLDPHWMKLFLTRAWPFFRDKSSNRKWI